MCLGQGSLRNSIPTEIGLLTSLSTLDFTYNDDLIGTIPDEIFMLTNMREIALFGCYLTGTISTSIRNWTSLEVRLLLFLVRFCTPLVKALSFQYSHYHILNISWFVIAAKIG